MAYQSIFGPPAKDTKPTGTGGYKSLYGLKYNEGYTRDELNSQNQQKLKQVDLGLSKGKSWEDIAKNTGLSLEEVQSYSQKTRPNYGVKPGLAQQAQTAVGNTARAVGAVAQDVSGITAKRDLADEQAQQILEQRKKAIRTSSVLSPTTKKQVLGELQAQQDQLYTQKSITNQADLQALNGTVDNPAFKVATSLGAGVNRSITGAAQGASGLVDLVSPGKGQSAVTKRLNAGAEGVDNFVKNLSYDEKTAKENEAKIAAIQRSGVLSPETKKQATEQLSTNQTQAAVNNVAYKSGQLTGEAAQMLLGAEAIKAMASLPGAAKFVSVAGKADELEKTLRAVNKGGKAGEAAITAARYLLDPARVANIAQNTAIDQGQRSAKGEKITAKSVGTSVALNYALGGVLDTASAGLARRADNKATKALDTFNQADNARISSEFDNTALDGLLPTKIDVKQQGSSYQGAGKVVDEAAYQKLTNKLNNNYEKEIAQAAKQGPLTREKAMNAVDEKYSRMQESLDQQLGSTQVQFKRGKGFTQAANVESSATQASVPGQTMNADVEAPTATLSAAVPGRGSGQTPISDTQGIAGVANTTEARAIQNDLTTGFSDLPTYEKINLEDQAAKTVQLMDADYEAAKQIALGNTKAPEGILPTSVYKGVERRALQEGDVATLHQLATESKIVGEATKAGQYNAALAQKDPESPLVAMQKVIKARKDSKLPNVPKDLNPQEAQKITELAKETADAKAAIPEGSPAGSPERLDYGIAAVQQRSYTNELLEKAKTNKEKYAPTGYVKAAAGTMKAAKATFDNSFFGRQGRQMLTTHPKIWADAFVKSFGDMAKEFKGIDAIDVMDAELLSRPNAINGLYKRAGVDVHTVEEAFPNSLPEKVPILGRLFKASESAYTGGAHRMRADLADQFIERAEKGGIDVTDKSQVEKIGNLVNAMTGRGKLKHLEKSSEALNVLFFSPRNLRASFDTLTAHQLQRGSNISNRDPAAKFVRKEAAKNLANIVITTAAVLGLADQLMPGSVTFDPRSSNFGKIKVGNTRFDITGGMAGIATLASRLVPTPGKDGIGFHTKSSSTGELSKLNSGEFGGRTGWGVLQDYIDGKLSPTAGAVKQLLTGTNFAGDKITPGSVAKDLTVPLPITNFQELRKDPKSANVLMAMIADGLGIGTNTYSGQKDWNQSNTKKLTGFKQKVGEEKFNKANQDFNDQYTVWLEKVNNNSKYKALSPEARKTLTTAKTQDLTDEVLKKYNYEYKAAKKSNSDKNTVKSLKGL